MSPSQGPRGWWRRLFAAPVLESADETREAEAVLKVTPLICALLIALTATFWLPGVSPNPGFSTAFMLVAVALLVPAIPLARSGRVAIASYWLVVGLLALIGTAVALFGGLNGSVASALIIPVLVGGALRGRRGIVASSLAAAAVATLLLPLELRGITPLVIHNLEISGSWFAVLTVLGLAVASLRLFARTVEFARRDVEESTRRARASEEQLADTIRQSPDGVALFDADNVLVSCNPAFESLFGASCEDLRERPFEEVTASARSLEGDERPDLRSLLDRGSEPAEWRLVSGDGRDRHAEVRALTVRHADDSTSIQLIVHDVTEKRAAARLQDKIAARLRESERLESIGRLAGGIAHDFRNLLTAIIANAELALEHSSMPREAIEDIEEIAKAGERASNLTQQLLAFARRQVVDPAVVDLSDVVDNLRRLLPRVLRDDVELVIDTPASCPVLADLAQLEQVIINLAANAKDAMPSGGRLTIETLDIELDDAYAQAHPNVDPGRYALLVVTDTGEGMDETTIEHVFDPFFTTKPVGEGTGLGLATVHGIITQAGGHITVYSEPGRGTCFRAYFPLVDDVVEAKPTLHPPATQRIERDATVIIADDEPVVRQVGGRILRSQGFRVLEASDGEQALQIASKLDGELELLVTDVLMPRMTGPELAERLRARHSDLAVLYISGYTENAIVHNGELDAGVVFVAKPFTVAKLLEGVQRALSARP